MYPPNYSAKDPAITQRPPASALLCVDAFDRYKSYDDARDTTVLSSPYNFTISKNQSILNGFFTRVGVSEVVFPWVVPNVNATTQDIELEFDAGAGPAFTTLTLDIGFYTPALLAARLQTLVRAADASLAGFTMTYGVKTIGTAVSVNQPIFEYKTNNPAAEVAFHPVDPGVSASSADNRRKQLFDLLGFNANNEALSLEFGGISTFCQATRYIDIICSALTNNQALKDSMTQTIARDTICRIYVGDAQGVQSTVLPSSATFCPPGCAPTTIYINFSVPKFIQWMPNQPVPGSLKFEVYDDAGFLLEDMAATEAESGDWSLTLLVSEN